MNRVRVILIRQPLLGHVEDFAEFVPRPSVNTFRKLLLRGAAIMPIVAAPQDTGCGPILWTWTMPLMRRNVRASCWLILLAVALPTPVAAQTPTVNTSMPNFGFSPPPPEEEETLAVTETNVGIIDPSLPLTMARIRVDGGFHMPRPVRAEYFQAKPGFLGGRGQPLAETNVAYQDITTYGEYAWLPFFSTFIEAPYRLLNPNVNANAHGYSDVNYGFKLCTWSSDGLVATIQFRLYNPTGNNGLGNGHWTAEPALTGAYRLSDSWLFEGEFRYWAPLNGSDFAGDMFRYGLGVSYGKRDPGGFWYIPVLEGVGWSVLSGQSLVASSPTDYMIQDAKGQTIFNGYLGLRLGYGTHIDGYLGYGRCFTGDMWQRDFVRAELRFIY
jgi:hypothetical protein